MVAKNVQEHKKRHRKSILKKYMKKIKMLQLLVNIKVQIKKYSVNVISVAMSGLQIHRLFYMEADVRFVLYQKVKQKLLNF